MLISIQHRDWVVVHGRLGMADKEALLHSVRFGLHACPVEAFGIAVAEMLKLGCVTFVPNSGGAPEVVGDARTIYESVDDAVVKIDAVLRHESLQQELQDAGRARSAELSAERFQRELLAVVHEFLGGQGSPIT